MGIVGEGVGPLAILGGGACCLPYPIYDNSNHHCQTPNVCLRTCSPSQMVGQASILFVANYASSIAIKFSTHENSKSIVLLESSTT